MPARQILTDNEGAILTLVLREQPLTTYQIAKFFDSSPVHTLNTSKGALYPLVHRLEDRGLLKGEEIFDDKRRTRRFSCTATGKRALKRWVLTIRSEHELLHDPLRKKLQGFGLLTREEQIGWIEAVQSRLKRKLEDVENWPAKSEGPLGEIVHRSASMAIKARLGWLDSALKLVSRS